MNTVFYADDDTDDLQVFEQALKEVDSTVGLNVSESGEELMDSLKNPPPTPTIIFLDLNMPGKDGRQTLKEIKSNDRFKNYPVVIFSTSSNPDDIDFTYQHGASMFITKPSSYHDLKSILSDCIGIDWKNNNRLSREEFYRSAS